MGKLSQGWKPSRRTDSIGHPPLIPAADRRFHVSLTKLVLELIDLRSFSNLWYWIALAVTWSTASHWILGVPYDMVLRARRHGDAAMADLQDMVRIHVNRILFIVHEAGLLLLALVCCGLTMLGLLGFWYEVEFCQAVFLLFAPLTIIAALSIRTAHKIKDHGDMGEDLCRKLSRHRIVVQVIGMISIVVTAMWGMLQNFNISPLG